MEKFQENCINLDYLIDKLSYCKTTDDYLKFYNEIQNEMKLLKETCNNYMNDIDKQVRQINTEVRNQFEFRRVELIDEINMKIKQYHNPNLIEPEESPNKNIIYKLYDNFCCTHEKGGWAYGDRSQFTHLYPLIVSNEPEIVFPLKEGNRYFAIMTSEQCREIHELYQNYKKLFLL